MKALTIDALWAWAILEGLKRVENRVWRRDYRGRLVIHAGTNTSREAGIRAALQKAGVRDLPSTQQLDALRGHLVGTVELADIVAIDGAPQQVRSEPFCEGPYCWLLSDPRRLKRPVPCRGAQQLWNVPDELVAKLK